MLDKEDMVRDISKAFASLSAYIQLRGKLNLTDAHVQSESFVQDLLNAVYGWRLVGTNRTTANYPCIDLLDGTRKLGVQVSSDNSSAKINATLRCLAEHGLAGTISALKVFVLGDKQGQYTIKTPCPGITFDWEHDVLDFESLLNATNNLADGQIRAVHRCVVEAMPSIFPDRVSAAARKTDFCIRTHFNQTVSVGIASCRWCGPAMKPDWLETDPARMSDPWIVARFSEQCDLHLYFAGDWGDSGTWLVVDRGTNDGRVLNHDQLRELRQVSATTTTTPAPGHAPSGTDEDAAAWRAEYRRKLGDNLHATLDRIDREMSNFEKMAEGRATSGTHRKAVEVYSFELLAERLTKIKDARGYPELVVPLLAEIERVQVMPSGEKDVTAFLELLRPLHAKLEVDVQGYPPPK